MTGLYKNEGKTGLGDDRNKNTDVIVEEEVFLMKPYGIQRNWTEIEAYSSCYNKTKTGKCGDRHPFRYGAMRCRAIKRIPKKKVRAVSKRELLVELREICCFD
jgi:hypothetical protein